MKRTEPEFRGLRASVIDAFRADEPDAAGIQRAYLRFSWARRRPPQRSNVFRWVAIGAALGFGAAAAAPVVVLRGVSELPRTEGIATSAEPGPKARLGRRPSFRVSAALAAPSTMAPVFTAPFTMAPASAAPSARATVFTARPAASVPVGPSAPAPEATPLRTARSTSSGPRAALNSAPNTEGSWQRLARAMRDNDQEAVEHALSTLEQGDSTADREAAQLVRAQLLISRGKSSEARPILERLSRRAHSDFIRSRSAALLSEL